MGKGHPKEIRGVDDRRFANRHPHHASPERGLEHNQEFPGNDKGVGDDRIDRSDDKPRRSIGHKERRDQGGQGAKNNVIPAQWRSDIAQEAAKGHPHHEIRPPEAKKHEQLRNPELDLVIGQTAQGNRKNKINRRDDCILGDFFNERI